MGSRVSENARERELLRYDPTLLENITFNDQGRPRPSSQLRTSTDPILTSLAQLGACRTRTSRSLVSIFDHKWQYIIAEATPSLTLTPDVAGAESGGNELWLSRTAIPRSHGVCDWALTHNDGPASPCAELPVTIVQDVGTDPRFCQKPYCLTGSPARFYAAAPIRSPRGINIGVYCVIHTEPILEQDARYAGMEAVVRDIARTIMRHLEARRATVAWKRSQSMINGIASFMNKQNTLLDSTRSEAVADDLSAARPDVRGDLHKPDDEQETGTAKMALRPVPPDDRNETHRPPDLRPSPSLPSLESAGGKATAAENPNDSSCTTVSSLRPSMPSRNYSSAPTLTTPAWLGGHETASIGGICTRAASLLHASLGVDHVVYLNASPGAFGSRIDAPDHPDHSSDPITASSSDEVPSVPDGQAHDKLCQILGVSQPPSLAAGTATATPAPQPPSMKLLSSLLKRYPRGKIFNFDENGTLQSSDSSEDGLPSASLPEAWQQPQKRPSNKRLTTHREGEVLALQFPGARSIAFAPIWDDKKGRWFAGSLLFTCDSNRVFTTVGELSYLRAFGALVMTEIQHLETSCSYQAQSDVLGSLSHELRSPLHGLILSTELLADTCLDAFQGNVLHTIETCGRTLLDTVDHLLEYSKVNNFMSSATKAKTKARGMRGKGGSIEDGMKTQLSDVRLDTLVEEVVESVFAGFQRMSAEYSLDNARKRGTNPDVGASVGQNAMMVINGPKGIDVADGESASAPSGVSIYLDIESSTTYNCSTVAGAIRRIVMNLVGNSLKYTKSGWVEVSLSRDATVNKIRGVKQRLVRIAVTDTGKGMSKDFLAHDVYKPFMQENHLSAGTGVGLSLVKKVVSALRGDISIKSQVDVGTIITVLLPLPSVDYDLPLSTEDGEFEDQRKMLKGLRVHLTGFQHEKHRLSGDSNKNEAEDRMSVAARVCRDWLGMEIITASPGQDLVPDLVLCTTAIMDKEPRLAESTARPPVVVVCPNAVVAHSRTMAAASQSHGGAIFEYIAQPTGPRKLAKVLLLAFHRWMELQNDPNSSISKPSTPSTFVQADDAGVATTNRNPGGIRLSFTDAGAEEQGSYFPPIPKPGAKTPESKTCTVTETCASKPDTAPLSPKVSRPLVPPSPPLPRPKTPRTVEFLLVDDSPINLRILCAYMKKLQRSFATAVDGLEAVDMVKAQPTPFACILIDINMPRMDGLQATQHIRAHERDTGAQACSIFALTGLASAEVQKEAFESGVDLFLTKPVTLKELSDILGSRGLI